MAQRFNIEEQENKFEFELDNDGYIWFFENGLDKPKVNIGQKRIIPKIELEEAKELAREMLFVSGYIEKK